VKRRLLLWVLIADVALMILLLVAGGCAAKNVLPLEVDFALKGAAAPHAVKAAPDVELEYPIDTELSKVASVFAMRPIEVRCPTLEQWAENQWSEYAWGYTQLDWSLVVLDPGLCAALHEISSGAAEEQAANDWQRAVAVQTLVHESYHERRWELAGSEKDVQCRAVRHWRYAMRFLGASPREVDRLMGWQLMAHWRLVRLADVDSLFSSNYYAPRCNVPNPW
jgi:hypothetical protein